jgi:hypothetical protein
LPQVDRINSNSALNAGDPLRMFIATPTIRPSGMAISQCGAHPCLKRNGTMMQAM